MAKQSAGLLLYRRRNTHVEVLLVHPGGPFWAKKDANAWSIPKGEIEEGEDLLTAAKREFGEETGQSAPGGNYVGLGSCKTSSGKQIFAWAVESSFDVSRLVSNMTHIEWPPRSGRDLEIPEVDRASWVLLDRAPSKLHKGQDAFVRRLAEILSVELDEGLGQQSLLL